MGAWLLLHLPEKTFTAIVPVLLIVALIMVVIGPRIQRWAQDRAEKAGRSPEDISAGRMAVLVSSTFAIGVYGGYFTAAQGILLVGVMGALLPESVQRMNAAKNLLTLLVNVVAALAYTLVAFHRISWPVAGLIAVGSLVGGWLGARYGRRLSPNALRGAIVVVGLIGLYRLLSRLADQPCWTTFPSAGLVDARRTGVVGDLVVEAGGFDGVDGVHRDRVLDAGRR